MVCQPCKLTASVTTTWSAFLDRSAISVDQPNNDQPVNSDTWSAQPISSAQRIQPTPNDITIKPNRPACFTYYLCDFVGGAAADFHSIVRLKFTTSRNAIIFLLVSNIRVGPTAFVRSGTIVMNLGWIYYRTMLRRGCTPLQSAVFPCR